MCQCLLGIPVSMSPAFAALFTFCFALALDVLFQTNMQKYALEAGRRWPARRLCRTPWGT